MRAQYACYSPSQAAVALAANTAKTVVGAKAHANSGLDVLEWEVSFDGVTASAVPVFVELCYATFATNAPGTNSTSLTPLQQNGRVMTAGFTAGHTWTTEPTVLSVIDHRLLTPNGGVMKWAFPLGSEPDCALGEGFAIRCKAPAAVNVIAGLKVARN